jgi:hypothetical protein
MDVDKSSLLGCGVSEGDRPGVSVSRATGSVPPRNAVA